MTIVDVGYVTQMIHSDVHGRIAGTKPSKVNVGGLLHVQGLFRDNYIS